MHDSYVFLIVKSDHAIPSPWGIGDYDQIINIRFIAPKLLQPQTPYLAT